MSLEPIKTKGFQKGQIANPAGKPKGTHTPTTVEGRLLRKWKTHPLDKLVKMANWLEQKGSYSAAADIWIKLLPYFDAPKKAGKIKLEEVTSVEPSEDAEQFLENLENGFPPTEGGESPSVATGTVEVPIQTSPEGDVREHKE